MKKWGKKTDVTRKLKTEEFAGDLHVRGSCMCWAEQKVLPEFSYSLNGRLTYLKEQQMNVLCQEIFKESWSILRSIVPWYLKSAVAASFARENREPV